MFFSKSALYTVHKSRQIFRERYQWYKRNGQDLDSKLLVRIEQLLEELDKATVAKDRKEADRLAREVESIPAFQPKKTVFWYLSELVVAIAVALVIATCVRVMWFEPMKIPTGSMRPSFNEQDHLLVSKTAFGINVPMSTSHFYFDPSMLKRHDVVIWSGDNVDLPDTDTMYFWLFPGKKRYVKRLMGLPGDSLYFYGGRIYGVDSQGNDISDELSPPGIEKLEHVPFNTFEGRISVSRAAREAMYEVTLRHMNRPVGRFNISSYGVGEGQIYNGREWVKENPMADREPHDTIQTYDDFIGIRNFAMARLLTKQQAMMYSGVDVNSISEGMLYLELRHSPNVTNPKPRAGEGPIGQLRVALTPMTALIPLQDEDLKAIMQAMYTSRFVVKNGYATAWQSEGSNLNSGSPEMPGIPDGDYEFYYGKAYSLDWGGVRSELAPDHPLYQATPRNVQLLFNLGLEFNTVFTPFSTDQLAFPSRYAYFRDGDLYIMGAPLFNKDSAILKHFMEGELAREKASSKAKPYVAFRDYGPPMKDGKVDLSFIRTFGVTIPEKHYMVLGDNHARSADSRTFGFIPQENIQGAPSFLLWPAGDRWGAISRPHSPWINLASAVVWSIAALCAALWYYREHCLNTRPLFKRIK
ncbi:MAG: signal peptidase I [Nitrosomonas sp.]|nr:MAG: signal peptidase I [Nitrosomonas sp.]